MARPPLPLKLRSPEQTGPPLLQRATLAISTGAGCLACTSHAKASLLFAFLPPAFSLGRCFPLTLLGMEHPCIPASRGVSWGWEPQPPWLLPLWGVGGLGIPRRGAQLPLLFSFLPPRICALLKIINCFI